MGPIYGHTSGLNVILHYLANIFPNFKHCIDLCANTYVFIDYTIVIHTGSHVSVCVYVYICIYICASSGKNYL